MQVKFNSSSSFNTIIHIQQAIDIVSIHKYYTNRDANWKCFASLFVVVDAS